MNPNDPNNNPTPTPNPDPNLNPNPDPTPTPQPEPQTPPVAPPQPGQSYGTAGVASAGQAPLQPVAGNPGKGLGIASLITSIVGLGLVGLILGLIGLNKSKKVGMSNGLAIAGIIVGVLGMLFGLLLFIVAYNGVSEAANEIVSACANSTSGVVALSDGSNFTCPE